MNDSLAERVARIIPRYSMLAAGQDVGVAVSGGADSVVLLHLLHRLSPPLGVGLKVLHVNHQLRGNESESDEIFVRQLAESLGLECLVERSGVPDGNLEQAARLQRRAFFRRCMAEHHLARIALGHTRSDQAETVLFRLLRGSGLAGLAGMRPVTADGLIRPLLTSSRKEVRDWARVEGLGWREDSSNFALEFARNRLRNEAMPALTSYFNSNLEAVLAATAELAQDEESYWFEIVEPAYHTITERTHLGSILQTEGLRRLHIAVQRRVVRRALLAVRGDLKAIEKSHIDAILAICSSSHGHDRVMVPGVDALRSFHSLLLRAAKGAELGPRHYRLELKYDEPCHLPFGAGTIYVKRMTPGVPNCANFKKDQELLAEETDLNGLALASSDRSPVRLFVRNWEPGDQLQRVGHEHREKVKTLFQQGRVLLWERRHWPVVVAEDEIVWVRQFGSAAKFAGSVDGAQQIRICYRKSGG